MAIFCHSPPRQFDAVLEALADPLAVAFRQPVDDLVGVAMVRRPFDALLVVARLDAADGDVVAGGEIVAHEILEDDTHVGAQLFDVVFAKIAAVEQDAAFVGVVQPGQQLHQGGLAGAVLADQRHHLAGLEREAEMAHRPASRRRDR